MDSDRLLRFHRPRLRAGDAPVLQPRAPLGQRGARGAVDDAPRGLRGPRIPFDARLGARAWLTTIADALLSVALSPSCAGCSAPLEHPTRGPVCDACWRASASGIYDGPLQNIIHAFKYDGRRSLANGLAALMRARHADILERADAAVPVPLHPSKRRSRGFNQADDLARRLGPSVVRALRRTRATAAQAELAGDDRAANVAGAFAPARGAAAVYGRVVVLVDDVTTTGATLAGCAGVLKACGAREVHAVTAAVAVRRSWT